MNPIELGKFIANLRNEKGLTQEELAEKLFIDKRKVSRWECGTSIPEFEMLIKLTEILDVSLYELSICQRFPKDKLSTKLINKFTSIKDLKKYKAKKIIKIIFLILLFIFFSITTFYTLKYNDTIEIYELDSLDDKYDIEGNYIVTNKFYTLNITNIRDTNSKTNLFSEYNRCDFNMYNNNSRFFQRDKTDINLINHLIIYNEENKIKDTSDKVIIKATCYNKNISKKYSIEFKLLKKYDNKLF